MLLMETKKLLIEKCKGEDNETEERQKLLLIEMKNWWITAKNTNGIWDFVEDTRIFPEE